MFARKTIRSVLGCALLAFPAISQCAVLEETATALSQIESAPASAAERLQKLVAANPYNGGLFFELATAQLRAKQYDAAIESFKKAIDLGQQPPAAMYNIACCHALSGRKSQAIEWIEKALNNRFVEDELLRTDKDLDSLRSDPEFIKHVGFPAPKLDRVDAWSYDLDYLQRRMEQLHFNVYAKITKPELTAEFEKLKQDATKLNDEQLLVRLRKVIARIGDGHTRVVPADLVDGKTTVCRAPIDLYAFSDGVFVRGADVSQASLVGAQVLKVGELDVDRALSLLEPYVSVDNRMGYLKWTPMMLMHAAYLREIGAIAPEATSLQLTIDRKGKAETVEVPLVESPRPKFGRLGIVGYKSAARDVSTDQLPIAQRNADRAVWSEYDPERKLAYFFFGQVLDTPDRKLTEHFADLFKLIDDHDARHLVIDMRYNGGGNNFLLKPLLHGLIRREKLHHDRGIFVITSRNTYSAAVNALGLLEWNLNPIFVGEPPAAGPVFVGEGNRILLPCSGHTITCSSRYWQQWASDDRRAWYAPHISTPQKFEDFVNRRDAAMEAICQELESN